VCLLWGRIWIFNKNRYKPCNFSVLFIFTSML
jgi:hypothetical protein